MLGQRQNFSVKENKICFSYEKGDAYIEVIRDDIINVFVPLETKEHFSKAIEGEKAVDTKIDVQEEKDAEAGSINAETQPTPTPVAEKPEATASAAPTEAADATQSVADEVPLKEEKVIEETMVATTTKTVAEKEREIETKREEESFKSLVIADVNDYVNVRSIPSEEGEILGKLYDESVGEFIPEQDG